VKDCEFGRGEERRDMSGEKKPRWASKVVGGIRMDWKKP